MQKFYKYWAYALLVKVVIAVILPLIADETYYWFWGHHLQLSYYDHPPAVAWLFKLGSLFENFGHASRWPGVFLAHFSILFWAEVLKKYLNETQLLWFLILMLANPMTGPGSLVITPDTPLLFFWSAAIYCFDKALEEPSFKWYSLLGVSLGLGFCSKYNIVLFVPIVLMWLVLNKEYKKINYKALLLTVLMGFIFSLPVLIWNYQNHFDSFLFQLKRGVGQTNWNWRWTTDYILSQLFILFPTTIWFATKKTKTKIPSYFYYFAWFPFIFFLFTSLKGRVEANWTLIGFPAVLALVAVKIPDFKIMKKTVYLWAFACVAAISVLLIPSLDPIRNQLKTREYSEYIPLMSVAKSFQPFYASSFQMASVISYGNRIPVYKLKDMGRHDFFDYLQESIPTEDTYFVAVREWDKLPDWATQHTIEAKIKINDTFTLWQVKQK